MRMLEGALFEEVDCKVRTVQFQSGSPEMSWNETVFMIVDWAGDDAVVVEVGCCPRTTPAKVTAIRAVKSMIVITP